MSNWLPDKIKKKGIAYSSSSLYACHNQFLWWKSVWLLRSCVDVGFSSVQFSWDESASYLGLVDKISSFLLNSLVFYKYTIIVRKELIVWCEIFRWTLVCIFLPFFRSFALSLPVLVAKGYPLRVFEVSNDHHPKAVSDSDRVGSFVRKLLGSELGSVK